MSFCVWIAEVGLAFGFVLKKNLGYAYTRHNKRCVLEGKITTCCFCLRQFLEYIPSLFVLRTVTNGYIYAFSLVKLDMCANMFEVRHRLARDVWIRCCYVTRRWRQRCRGASGDGRNYRIWISIATFMIVEFAFSLWAEVVFLCRRRRNLSNIYEKSLTWGGLGIVSASVWVSGFCCSTDSLPRIIDMET